MSTALVGYTGFVGSNLANQIHFDALYNSKNIQDAYGTCPDLLIYAGIPAEMYLANSFPERDKALIYDAYKNMERIRPQTLVLISSISVYGNPVDNKNEDSLIDKNELTAYGKNRRILEELVLQNFKDCLVIRLPALYGNGLKKNYIYDCIHLVPKMLKAEKYKKLTSVNVELPLYYEPQNNGFYKCKELASEDKQKLISFFKSIDFTALNFTDTRSEYQFYNLAWLGNHINLALRQKLRILNLATEPVQIQELHRKISGVEYINELSGTPYKYNMKTKHSNLFNGENGYIMSKNRIINDICSYIICEKRKEGIL